MDELNKKFNLNEKIYPMYKKFHTEELAKLFPRVPTAILFMNSNLTTRKLEYKENYHDLIKKNQFPEILKNEYTFGDKTVPSFSSILPGLRWAYKYENNKNNKNNDDYYPVKFVEYCSGFNTNQNIYQKDKKNVNKNVKDEINAKIKDNSKNEIKNDNKINIGDEIGEKIKNDLMNKYENEIEKINKKNEKNRNIKENGYIGLKCQCMGENLTNYKNCKHSTIHSDPNVIRFIYDFVVANQVVGEKELEEIKGFDEEVLEEEVRTCSHIVSHVF